MNERLNRIAKLIGTSFHEETVESIVFNKDEIILEILEKLPEPWIWFTVNKRMNETMLSHEENIQPSYDFILTKKKIVKEQKSDINPFSAINSEYVYNINIGINVVDNKKINRILDDDLITIGLEIHSCRQLLNLLEELDSEYGGIKPCQS